MPVDAPVNNKVEFKLPFGGDPFIVYAKNIIEADYYTLKNKFRNIIQTVDKEYLLAAHAVATEADDIISFCKEHGKTII